MWTFLEIHHKFLSQGEETFDKALRISIWQASLGLVRQPTELFFKLILLLYFHVETSAAQDSDKINVTEAKRMTTVSELEKLTENKLPERGNANQAFWCEEKDLEKIELFQGDHVRLKTKGGGPLIGKE